MHHAFYFHTPLLRNGRRVCFKGRQWPRRSMEEGSKRFLETVLAEVLAHLEPPRDGRIRHDWSPRSLRKTTDLELPLVGSGLDRVLEDIRTYLSNAVRTDQPGFMNPLWGGLTPEGLAGELVTAATNTSMYTYEIAPLASLIETAVLDRMRQHLRMPSGAGTLTTGGSNGNLMGVLCARHAALPASGHDGLTGVRGACLCPKRPIIRWPWQPMCSASASQPDQSRYRWARSYGPCCIGPCHSTRIHRPYALVRGGHQRLTVAVPSTPSTGLQTSVRATAFGCTSTPLGAVHASFPPPIAT